MIVKCIHNTGVALLDYERIPTGLTQYTTYGQLEIGEEYLVMGIILRQGYLTYLIDGAGVISACPNQLFEVLDSKIPSSWFFKSFTKEYFNYINQEAVWGYSELVFDDNHYENLIEMNKEAHNIYFDRKRELEKG
ncbi:hypothetical protein [Spongiimicrobium sp. 2-473A-2-J]|uniref:hypothetical protein n=1 Tax=Eudoraea algarum TaxID=3417568 RepID=UPI003D361978